MDLLKELGPLGLASRLRRLSNRLMTDVSSVYAECNIEFYARWFPITYLLKNESPLTITTIANKLGMRHPVVIKISEQMLRHNLLLSRQGKRDRRQRLLSLSPKGKRLAKKLEVYWNDISECIQQLIDNSDVDLLAAISEIEAELDKETMYERIINKRKDIIES